MPRRTKIRVIEKKLGRERALGMAYMGEDTVEIDPRQSPQEYMDTVVHEVLHIAQPDMAESTVAKTARKISSTLWRLGYRRTHQ